MSRGLPIVEKLQQELAVLKRELNVDIPRLLEQARAHGDLRENAEYHATKERQGMLHARIGQIETRLGELSLYTRASIPTDRAGYGSSIVVVDVASGERITYKLVFPEEADASNGDVSMISPIGRSLLNRRPGDEVVVTMPSGRRTLEILELVTIHAAEDAAEES
jgi:transcription elongation factor GreA